MAHLPDSQQAIDTGQSNGEQTHVISPDPKNEEAEQTVDEGLESPNLVRASSLPACSCLIDDAQGELSKETIAHVMAGVPQHVLWLVGVVTRQEKAIESLSEQLQQATQRIEELKRTIEGLSSTPPADALYRRGTRLPVKKMNDAEPVTMHIPGRQGITYTRQWLLANRSPIVADSAANDLHINVNLFPGAFTNEPIVTDKHGNVFPSASPHAPRRFGEDRWDHSHFSASERADRPIHTRTYHQKEHAGRLEPSKSRADLAHKSDNAWKPPMRGELSEEQALGQHLLNQLNKLTTSNFDAVSANIIGLLCQVTQVSVMVRASEVFFEKAIAEKHFAPIYGKLCQTIRNSPELKQAKGQQKELGFAFQLLGRCQREYEGFRNTAGEIKGDSNLRRKRFLGMAIFLGELYNCELLNDVILRGCINGLIKELDSESEETIEVLCQLLEKAGPRLERDEKNQVPAWFEAIKASADRQSTARLRFMLQNLVELRDRKWLPRVVQSVEIHKEHTRVPQVHTRDPRTVSEREPPVVILKRGSTTSADGKLRRK